ncbi:MAG: threonine ammonia-lyase [Oscillospiraceae bacterium]|jgi:threonine dehydratase|nr:threonine ammonia-lyase [Oscillospiraceae bacterium]
MRPVTLSMIFDAQQALKGFARRTDLLPASSSVFGVNNEVLLKAENLQRTGSFKVRGAYNRMRQMDREESACGVICASAGNHAQGVALAARELGIRSSVVMPEGAPISKLEATRAYGAEAILHGDSFSAAQSYAFRLQKERGMVFIHAFDDPFVIAGQGTVGLEIVQDRPDVKTVLVPIGGGGLAAGVALAIKETRPGVRVVGVEPENAASMLASFEAGKPVKLTKCQTIADGVAVKSPGDLTYKLCRHYLDEIITVSDADIAAAILAMLERTKMLVEGAGAVPLAALMATPELAAGGPTVAVVTGGNIDVNILERIIEKGLMNSGRRARLSTYIADRPGHLSKLLDLLAGQGVNVLSVSHDRLAPTVALGQTAVSVEVETRNQEHIEATCAALLGRGYHLVQPMENSILPPSNSAT